MAKISWRTDKGRIKAKIDDGPEIIIGDGNISYRQTHPTHTTWSILMDREDFLAMLICISIPIIAIASTVTASCLSYIVYQLTTGP